MTNDAGFEKKTGAGGDWFAPPLPGGTFRLKLIGFAKGPSFKSTNPETGETTETPYVEWQFEVYRFNSGKRVTWVPTAGPNAGNSVDAVSTCLSSTTVSPLSKAGKWFAIVLGREVDFVNEEVSDMMEQALAKAAKGFFVSGTFGPNKAGKCRLLDISPMPADEDDEGE